MRSVSSRSQTRSAAPAPASLLASPSPPSRPHLLHPPRLAIQIAWQVLQAVCITAAVAATASLAAMLLGGCGGAIQTTDTVVPPAGQDGLVSVGPLQVGAVAADKLRVQSLPASGQCSFAAIYGARMNYLAATALLDRVVFSSNRTGNWQIYICNLDGSGLQQLTSNSMDDWYPVWSPDGSRIAFSRYSPGQGERICVMNADGSGVRALTAIGDICAAPGFSPDGRRIVFRSKRNGNQEIYIMYADGTCQRNLSDSPASSEWDPAWSPDGTCIALVSDRSGGYEIYTMDLDGRILTRLTDDSYRDEHPAWSPDGALLAYESDRRGVSEVMLMQSDGGGQRNFSASPYYDGMPCFSGNGKLIAFTSSRAGSYDIWLQERDGLQRAWPVTSDPADDDYADLGSPTIQAERVLIGPGRADRGCDPLWSSADAAVVAFDGDGYRSLVRIGIAPEHLSSLRMEPLEHVGTELVGLQVMASRVANLRQDEGPGSAPTVWDLSGYRAATVLLYLHADSGRLVSALVLQEGVASAGAAANTAGLEAALRAYNTSADSSGLRLSGQFAAVYDAYGRNLASDGARQVLLTTQGQVQLSH